MGSITHLALEWLAILSKQYQAGDELLSIKNQAIDFTVHRDQFLKSTVLTDDEVDKINRSRRSKDIYLPNAKLDYGHVRFGSFVVNTLVDKAYKFYTANISPTLNWTMANYKHCWNWTWMALEQYDRSYDIRFKKIIEPERQFEIELTEDWAKYEYDYMGEKLTGNLVLKGTIDLLMEMENGVIEALDYKGLALDTKLPTPNGWTTMGDVQVGDILFDIDGKQTKVTGKSEIKNIPCYEITFDDTSRVVCDEEHLWSLTNNPEVKVTDLKIGDKIYVSKPIELDYIDLPIDPYVLGLWLGDGRNRCGEICGEDTFCFEEIERRGYKLGNDISAKDRTCSKTVYGLTTELRKLNLLNNKHIPLIYLRSSYNQRLDLLRGLMDSDGSVNKQRKQCVFTNCNINLSNDVKSLLLSLGQRPLQSHVKNHGFGLVVDNHPISFRPLNINPFLLPRKANKIDKDWGVGNSSVRKIKKIDLIESVPTQCIMVDSPSHTFLCTENFIPTHNTGRMYSYAKDEPKTYDMLMEDIQLNFYYYCIRKLYPQYENVLISIYFVRDGGVQTLAFDDSYLPKTEKMIKDTFEHIKANNLPKLVDPFHNDKKCKYFCPFYKQKMPDGVTSYCDYSHELIKEIGMDNVVSLESYPGFRVGTYENPGI